VTAADEILEITDDFYQDPHRVYRELRQRGPIHRIRWDGVLGWLVVDHEVAKKAFLDPSISKRLGSPEGQAALAKNDAADMFSSAVNDNLLFSDPPQHTRLRRLVAKAFASRAMVDLGPRITEIADEMLDTMSGKQSVDLLDSYAFPLPIAVICELLGVPDDDKDAFRSWTAVLVDDASTIEERGNAGANFFTYLTELIAARTDNPRNDLLSELIIAKDDDDRLDHQELIAMLFLLLAAGHETTVNLIGNAVLELLGDPATAERLRHNPADIPGYLDEILRCQGSIHVATTRFTTAPITLGNQEIDAGEFIMISLAAANRDPEQFADPDRIDIERSDSRHLAFGYGIHYCLGAALARTEATVAVKQLLERYPEIALDTAAGEPVWKRSLLIRGLTSLPVRLNGASPAEPELLDADGNIAFSAV